MATGSSTSSSAGPRGAREALPVCPFCKMATVVERISRTINHPDMPFYTCRNRDWGNKKCSFFMWKPSSEGSSSVDAASVMASLTALDNSMTNLINAVSALTTDVNTIAGQQRGNKCMIVATLILGVVSFVGMGMLLYGN